MQNYVYEPCDVTEENYLGFMHWQQNKSAPNLLESIQ